MANGNTRQKLTFALLFLTTTFAHQNARAEQPRPKPLNEATIIELVQRCAPDVHPTTMMTVLKHESGFQPYVIGVNGKPRQTFVFATQAEAAQKARELIAAGKSIDMGLGQITSANLAPLKLTPETVFDPCTNIAAAAKVLTEAYTRTSARAPDVRTALDGALSIYNTGNPARGIANGYVQSVRGKRYAVPSIDEAGGSAGEGGTAEQAVAVRAVEEPEPPAWDVYAQARYRATKRADAKPAEPAPQQEPQRAQQQASAEPVRVMLFNEAL